MASSGELQGVEELGSLEGMVEVAEMSRCWITVVVISVNAHISGRGKFLGETYFN